MEKEKYTIKNPTNEVYAIFEVGRFVPGSTDLMLSEEQVNLVKDQSILSIEKANNAPAAPKPAAKAEKTE